MRRLWRLFDAPATVAPDPDARLLDALDYLRLLEDSPAQLLAPLTIVPSKWHRHVGDVQPHGRAHPKEKAQNALHG
jgi:hypothetical protein